MTGEEELDRELARMAGSPVLAEAVKKQIRALGDGVAGPQLAEMARELLDGRTGLRAIGQSGAYGEALTEAAGRYQDWYEALDEDQRRALRDDAQRLVGGEVEAGARPGPVRTERGSGGVVRSEQGGDLGAGGGG